MPMPPYPIRCYTPGCPTEAAYKIASRWSDGITHELKTYGLACPRCLAAWFQRSRARQLACQLARGETLNPPGIYQLTRGLRDREIPRRSDLEAQLLAEEPADISLPLSSSS